jgi:hypothetical protein
VEAAEADGRQRRRAVEEARSPRHIYTYGGISYLSHRVINQQSITWTQRSSPTNRLTEPRHIPTVRPTPPPPLPRASPLVSIAFSYASLLPTTSERPCLLRSVPNTGNIETFVGQRLTEVSPKSTEINFLSVLG